MFDQRLQANIAGFGQQHRTNTDRQIIRTGIGFTHMRKFIGKASMGVDFQ